MLGNLKDIIFRLEQQKAAIERALAVLKEVEGNDVVESSTPIKVVGNKGPKKRVMSEEGRRRIAEASRKRWAAHRKALKKAAA